VERDVDTDVLIDVVVDSSFKTRVLRLLTDVDVAELREAVVDSSAVRRVLMLVIWPV